MSRRNSITAMIALTLLTLVALMAPRVPGGRPMVDSDCCCLDPATQPNGCTGCCEVINGDDEPPGPTPPCECNDTGDPESPWLPSPTPTDRLDPAGTPLAAFRTPHLRSLVQHTWHTDPEIRRTTGPPIHVRHCVWLL